MAPPPTEIPSYVWSKKYDPKPLKIKSSKLIEIKVEEFYHPSKEVALKGCENGCPGKIGDVFRLDGKWKRVPCLPEWEGGGEAHNRILMKKGGSKGKVIWDLTAVILP